MLILAQNIFSSLRFYFFMSHLSLQSRGQVTLDKYLRPRVVYILSNSICLKYILKYCPFVKKEKYQDILDLEGSGIQDPKIHHLLYQWCLETTHQLMEEHYDMIVPHTKLGIVQQQFCTVEIKLIIF